MKYYSVDIQVDFDTPRDMQPRSASEKPWQAIGYDIYNIFSVLKSQKKTLNSLSWILSEKLKSIISIA